MTDTHDARGGASIQWGAEIRVNGERPEWLRDDDYIIWRKPGHDGWRGPCTAEVHNWDGRDVPYKVATTAIRLPADHPHYYPAPVIDWNAPLEAVHKDGRTMPVTVDRIEGNTVRIAEVAWGDNWYRADGKHLYQGRTRIRNVAKPVRTAAEHLERLEALVRELARMPVGHSGYASMRNGAGEEARAIVAEMAPPVDPDEQYARDLIREQGWQGEPTIGSEAVVVMIAKAHREGRARPAASVERGFVAARGRDHG